MERSPLAPETFPELLPVAGVKLATFESRIRYKGRDDLFVAELAPGTSVAGVFTKSLTAAAPVEWCRKSITEGNGKARVLVVNSGNANAYTGQAGIASVGRVVGKAAELFSCKTSEVFVSSTGTIGELLPDEKITAAMPDMKESLSDSIWNEAVQAIMTTDTFPKLSTQTAKIDDAKVTVNGMAKGSGMIAPNMATMLSYIFTDADIAPDVLQTLLDTHIIKSFNSITVDGDTSTSDTVLLFATGKASHSRITDINDVRLKDFSEKLFMVLKDLATQVVRDGEGANKFVEILVTGAESEKSAHNIGMCIAKSPLVKTAIAGEDPNWGRIVMAVGNAGEPIDKDGLAIEIGGIRITKNGKVVSGYDETPVAEHMKGQNIKISVDVGVGKDIARVWTCDFTHRYIDINADYRT